MIGVGHTTFGNKLRKLNARFATLVINEKCFMLVRQHLGINLTLIDAKHARVGDGTNCLMQGMQPWETKRTKPFTQARYATWTYAEKLIDSRRSTL